MNISVIITVMATLFIGIAIGYFIRKIKLISQGFSRELSMLVNNVALPAYIVASVLNAERTLSTGMVFALLGFALIGYAVAIAIAFLVTRLPIFPKKDKQLYMFMMMVGNVGFMAMPVISSLYPSEALFFAAVLNMPFNIIVYSLGIYFVSGGSAEIKFSPKMLLTPGVIAAVLAIVIYILDIRTPEILNQAATLVGQMMTPCAMIVLGATLAEIPVREVFNRHAVYVQSAVKLLAVPFLVWLVLRFMISDEVVLGVAVLLFAMPTATNSTMLTLQYGGNYSLASSSVFVSTLLSLITIPVIAALLL